jgi:hypothetical protein
MTAPPPALPGRRPQRKIGFERNQEPALVDLLTDPIVHRLMHSDGVRQDALIDLIADVKVRLAWQRASF